MLTVTTETSYERNREYVLAVLSRRCGWLAADEREAILHDAYVVLLEKERDGKLDALDLHPNQARAYLVQTAIHKALDDGKRAERKRTEPIGERALETPGSEPAPEDVAERKLDAARVREIIGELPARRQAIVKLRFFFERTPAEIQRMLAISSRVYRRDLERGLRHVADRYGLVKAGAFCESREREIIAFIAGSAEGDEAARAREHLASCPGCAHWAISLRSAARDVATAIPLPALASEPGIGGRIAELGSSLRDSIADPIAAAKQHATGLVLRADQGSAGYAATARPGTIAAVVASCLAAGGAATYCVTAGVPEPLTSLVAQLNDADARDPSGDGRGGDGRGEVDGTEIAPVSIEVPPPIEPATTPEAATTTAPPETANPQPAPAPEPEPEPEPQPAPEPPVEEFAVEGTAAPVAPAPATSTSSGGGSTSSSTGGGSSSGGGGTASDEFAP